jgi:CheY-like chemotaxis protein
MEIRVVDTGLGISPEFLPHIFSAFRQQDSSSTRRHGGLGLGLAISKQLVELHGGTIHAESAGVGRGATFCVLLPLQPASTEKPPRSEKSLEPLPANFNLNGLKILLVEDEAETRSALTMLLEKSGAKVTAVPAADAALQAYQQNRPALIISDLGLPGIDGFAFMHKIRDIEKDNGLSAIPSIALTAFARDDDRSASLEAGFGRHLSKPAKVEVLLQTVRDLIESK